MENNTISITLSDNIFEDQISISHLYNSVKEMLRIFNEIKETMEWAANTTTEDMRA